MTAPRPHPLELVVTPVWPDPDDDPDDLRAARGIIHACVLATVFWFLVIGGLLWMWFT